MEMHLQPLATACFVSGEPFADGARVASFLVRNDKMEIVRYDVLEPHAAGFAPEGYVACSWVQLYKPRRAGENPDRALKLTAESLFVALTDPTTEPSPENTRLVQFLALMLERKKILRPRGRTADGLRNRYEHAKTKQIFEVPGGELTPEFFVAVQEQLSVLVGAPKPKAQSAAAAPAGPAGEKPAETPAAPAEPAAAPVDAEPAATPAESGTAAPVEEGRAAPPSEGAPAA